MRSIMKFHGYSPARRLARRRRDAEPLKDALPENVAGGDDAIGVSVVVTDTLEDADGDTDGDAHIAKNFS